MLQPVLLADRDLSADPRSPAGHWARLTPGMLNAALTGAWLIERMRALLPPHHPRHRTIVVQIIGE